MNERKLLFSNLIKTVTEICWAIVLYSLIYVPMTRCVFRWKILTMLDELRKIVALWSTPWWSLLQTRFCWFTYLLICNIGNAVNFARQKLKCASSGRDENGSISEQTLSRSTQTNLSLPGVRQVSTFVFTSVYYRFLLTNTQDILEWISALPGTSLKLPAFFSSLREVLELVSVNA